MRGLEGEERGVFHGSVTTRRTLKQSDNVPRGLKKIDADNNNLGINMTMT